MLNNEAMVFPSFQPFSCGRVTTIRICYVWLRICLKMEVKVSVIKNIRIHVDGAKPIAFLPLSSLVRLPNYCLTNLCTSMLISRFLVSSLFSFLLYFRKRVLSITGFTILICSSSFVSFFVIVTNMERMEIF